MTLNYKPKVSANLISRRSGFGGFLNGILILMSYFKIRFNPGYTETIATKKNATRICSNSMLGTGYLAILKIMKKMTIAGERNEWQFQYENANARMSKNWLTITCVGLTIFTSVYQRKDRKRSMIPLKFMKKAKEIHRYE